MAENRGPGHSARKSRRSRPETIDLKATHIQEPETTTGPAAGQTDADDTVTPPVHEPGAGAFGEPEFQGPPGPGAETAAGANEASAGPVLPETEPADAPDHGSAPETPPIETPVTETSSDETLQPLREHADGDGWKPPTGAGGRDADGTNGDGSDGRTGIGALFAAGLAGALIAVTGLVLLAMLELLPLPGGTDAAIANRLTALERQAAEQPRTPTAGTDPQIGEFATALEEARGEVRAANAAIEELRGQVAAAGRDVPEQAPGEDPRIAEIAARIEAIAGQVATLAPEVEELRARESGAADETRQRLDQVETRISEAMQTTGALDGRIAAVEQATGSLPGIETQVKDMAAEVETARTAAAQDARQARATAAIALLDSVVSRGAPYGDALARVQNLVPEQKLQALEADAGSGLAPVAEPSGALMRALEALPAPGPAQEAGLVDRFLIGAQGLVTIRPVEGAKPQATPGSARARIHALLAAGEYADALEAWDGLDEAAKRATKAAADTLRARLDAERELQILRQRALAATGGEKNEGTEP